MIDGLDSHAARGTLGILAVCLFILWPPSVNFAAAAVVLAASIKEFRESFRVLDEAETASPDGEACE